MSKASFLLQTGHFNFRAPLFSCKVAIEHMSALIMVSSMLRLRYWLSNHAIMNYVFRILFSTTLLSFVCRLAFVGGGMPFP